MNRQQIATLALGALMLAPILAAPVMRAAPAAAAEELTAAEINAMPDPRRAWRDGIEVPGHRLIGLGCGAERLTYTAREEDELPAPCFAVAGPAEACGYDAGDLPTVAECAAYLGDGW